MTSYTHKRSYYYGRKKLTGKVVGRYFLFFWWVSFKCGPKYWKETNYTKRK